MILDEPTNHLDITSKEILENALVHYEGTVLFVSHDRYFINKTATRILDLHEQHMLNYIGNYDYYIEKKDTQRAVLKKENSLNNAAQTKEPSKESSGKDDWKQRKQEQAAKRKLENELNQVEGRIEQLEEEKKALETEMADPAVAVISAEVIKLHEQIAQREEELERLYERWENLTNL